MKNLYRLLAVALMAAAVLSGCGGGGGDNIKVTAVDPNPVLGAPITPTVPPITSFGQSIASQDTGTNNGYYDNFPGQANVWDIRRDLSLGYGNDDQFDGALEMTVGASTFLPDLSYSDLSFYSPVMASTDGVKVATVSNGVSMDKFPLGGTYSAFLNSTSDSRLWQTVDLSSGVTGTIFLSWKHEVSFYGGTMPGYTPSFHVVVRDFLTKNALETLHTATVNEGYTAANVDLTSYKSQKIVISFELHNMPEAGLVHGAMVDDVSIKDQNGAGTELIKNGDFETGNLAWWSANSPVEVQNMTTAERFMDNLWVSRSFYTVPNKLWGRWVDVFRNDTISAATTTVTYHTTLGSGQCGVIYDTPGTGGKAITSWDSSQHDRDVGMVFGLVSTKTYTSNPVFTTSYASCTGNVNISYDYVITVPAGGRVALVNFIILGSHDTGLTATSITSKAAEIDAEVAKIVSNFWTDGQYRTGMTQEQINAIKNF